MIKIMAWLVSLNRGQSGLALSRVVTAILVAFVGVMFVIQITPQIESTITAATITNTFVSAILDMAVWIIPVSALVGLFYGCFKLIKG